MAKKYLVKYAITRFYEIEVEALTKENAVERVESMLETDMAETEGASLSLSSEVGEIDEDMVESLSVCDQCREKGPQSNCDCNE
jgi:hypothetical protein